MLSFFSENHVFVQFTLYKFIQNCHLVISHETQVILYFYCMGKSNVNLLQNMSFFVFHEGNIDLWESKLRHSFHIWASHSFKIDTCVFIELFEINIPVQF